MPKHKLKLTGQAAAFFKKVGSKGGKARAKKHSRKQLSAWAKKGGRPVGSGKKKRVRTTRPVVAPIPETAVA